MQLSLNAVSYATWVLCEADDKQSALIRRANKVLCCSYALQLFRQDHSLCIVQQTGRGYFKVLACFRVSMQLLPD